MQGPGLELAVRRRKANPRSRNAVLPNDAAMCPSTPAPGRARRGGSQFCDTLSGVSSERAGEVMKRMVSMFSTGDLSELRETVHPDYVNHQGLRGEPIPDRPDSRRLSLRREQASRLSP